MKAISKIFFIASVCAVLASCASTAHYDPVDSAVANGDFTAALANLRGAKKSAYPERDSILYALDAGLLAHYAFDYKDSSKQLGDAERGIEAAFTKSITLEASSFLVNDNVKEYPGEDYEDVYLNVFNALNYYNTGSVEDAMVEIRRIDNKLKFISTKYGTAITGAQSAALEKTSEIPYDPAAATVKFSNSALARYLSMLFYRSEGKDDDARIDRDQVKLAFANQPSVYTFPLPKSLDNELSIPKGKARLNVISFNGPSPIKTQNTTRIALSDSNWLKIALPVITQRPSAIAKTQVVMDSGETFDLEVVENLGAVAAETFKQRAALIYFKTIVRSVAKTTSSALLKKGANEADDSGASLLLGVLSLGTQLYAEASEQADLRMSRYFPAKALIGGINLDPGLYSFTVKYFNASNTLIYEQHFKDVAVQSGKLNLSEAICIK